MDAHIERYENILTLTKQYVCTVCTYRNRQKITNTVIHFYRRSNGTVTLILKVLLHDIFSFGFCPQTTSPGPIRVSREPFLLLAIFHGAIQILK